MKYNQKKPTDKWTAGEIIRIPLAAKSREADDSLFRAGFGARVESILRLKPEPKEKIYLEALTGKLQEKIKILEFKQDLTSEKEANATRLGNLLNERRTGFVKNRDSLLKSLDRIKLKKQLDLLNSTNPKSAETARTDYKRKERVLFESLLIAIYDSKTIFIRQFQKEEGKTHQHKLESQAQMASIEGNSLEQRRKLGLLEVGQDRTKKTLVENAYRQARDQLDEEIRSEREKINRDYDASRDELAWRDYTTEMIYRGSTERRDSLAFGVAIKNVGAEMKFVDKNEPLPFALSADINYELLHLEKHQATLYGHYGYSVFESHHGSFGGMYRLLNRFELRTGLLLENLDSGTAVVVPTAGLALMLDLGLMNYRVDFSAVLRDLVGPTFTIGLNVVF